MSETQPGVDDVKPLPERSDRSASGTDEHDQDSEATLNAPEEDRPDGLDALDEGSDSTGGDGSPS